MDSAYEDADSVESSSTSQYVQSSVDSSAGDKDVSDGDGQSSVRSSKVHGMVMRTEDGHITCQKIL